MEIKKSTNTIQVAGRLNEVNLKIEEKQIELKKGDVTKKVTCNRIVKEDFKNPSVTIDVDTYDEDGNVTGTQTVGVNFFVTNEKRLNDNGNVEDNPMYKTISAIFELEKGTRVISRGSFSDNGYANDGEWKEYAPYVSIDAFGCSTSNVPEEDMADGKVSGIIRRVYNEVVNEEETGRAKIDFWMIDRTGSAFPIELTIPEDTVDDFSSVYEVGDCVTLDVELVSRQVGKTTPVADGGFRKRKSKMVNGYSVLEISVFGGSPKMEEENEQFIPANEMANLLKEREIMIEQKKKDSREKKKETPKSNTGGLKGRASKATPVEEDDECPF